MAELDLELVEKFKNGKEEAFEEIVRRYQKKVYNTTYRMLGNPEDAWDFAQEVFIRVFRNLHRFQGRASFSTWLFAIATNICRDELRKRQRKVKTQSLSEPIKMKDGEIEREVMDNSMIPEEITLHRELQGKIQTIIDTLPLEQKEVIILREFQDFSYDEIAETIGVAVGTVKSRISRGRKNLRQALSNFIIEVPEKGGLRR